MVDAKQYPNIALLRQTLVRLRNSAHFSYDDEDDPDLELTVVAEDICDDLSGLSPAAEISVLSGLLSDTLDENYGDETKNEDESIAAHAVDTLVDLSFIKPHEAHLSIWLRNGECHHSTTDLKVASPLQWGKVLADTAHQIAMAFAEEEVGASTGTAFAIAYRTKLGEVIDGWNESIVDMCHVSTDEDDDGPLPSPD